MTVISGSLVQVKQTNSKYNKQYGHIQRIIKKTNTYRIILLENHEIIKLKKQDFEIVTFIL